MKQQLQKIKQKLHLLFVFLMLISVTTMAQSRKTVTGTVTDNKGEALAGVSVLEKGTNNGASTNADGKFSISVSENAVLRFSFLGFSNKDVTVGTQTTLNVTLEDDAKALDEVVITGLGEQRDRKSLGYSITTVKGDDIRSANTSDPISALQGLTPGVVVLPGQGGPQSSPKFQIRGASSLFNEENTPLVVVDGIILSDDALLTSRGGEQDFGNILKNINADDIESVSILKGGSVTALYGSRATNGVILITTKKGYSQRGLGISFSHDQTFTTPYKLADMQKEYGSGLSLTDFRTGAGGMRQLAANWAFNFGPRFDGAPVLDVDGARQIPFSFLNNTLDLYETGHYVNSNLSMQGGNENTTFRFSYSNNYNKGVAPNNRQTRHSFNFRATQRLLNSVFLDGTVSYNNTKGYNPNRIFGDNSLLYGLTWGNSSSFDPAYWSKNYLDPVNGGIRTGTGDAYGTNSLFLMLYDYEQVQVDNNMRATLNARINMTKWLSMDANAATNLFNVERERKDVGTGVNFAGGNYNSSQQSIIDSRYKANLNFNHKVKDFDLFLQLGSEVVRSRSKGANYSTTGGLRVPRQYRISNSIGTPTITESLPAVNQMFAAFGQASIGYKTWLTLNVYGRNEWNSTLVYSNGNGNYNYFYPGADVAWIFSDVIKLPSIFDYSKLRASYSITGGGTEAYRANTGYYLKQGNFQPVTGSPVEQYQFDSGTLGNTNLKPLRSYSLEFGLENKMFNNRLGFEVAWYKKNTKNQIINLSVPRESGVTTALINSGDVEDKGIELLLYGTPLKTKNFSWDTYFNYTRNRTKINELAPGVTVVGLEGGDGIRTVAKVGGEYSTMMAQYGYALFQARDGSGNPIAHPSNGKRVIQASGVSTLYRRASNYAQGLEQERTIGSTLPKFYGSTRNVFNYKSFSLSSLIDAKIGGYSFSDTYYYGSQTGNLRNTLKYRTVESGGTPFKTAAGVDQIGVVLDGVYAEGTILGGTNVGGWTHKQAIDAGLALPMVTYNFYNASNNWANGIRERGAFKSSWVAVRDITLSYELPQSVTSRLKMNGIRLSASVRNLGFLYNNAPDNINVADFTSTGASSAFLGGGTPYVRTIAFGINGSF